MRIKISVTDKEAAAELNATKTARKIWESLPIKGNALRWGDEIYFYISTRIEKENPKQEVEVGDLAYWLEQPAICIFLGRTPASTSEKPRAASPVNVFGKIVSGLENLKDAKSNSGIIVEKI